MIRLLPAGLYTEMPWKNGQGVTREVARYPAPEAALDAPCPGYKALTA